MSRLKAIALTLAVGALLALAPTTGHAAPPTTTAADTAAAPQNICYTLQTYPYRTVCYPGTYPNYPYYRYYPYYYHNWYPYYWYRYPTYPIIYRDIW